MEVGIVDLTGMFFASVFALWIFLVNLASEEMDL